AGQVFRSLAVVSASRSPSRSGGGQVLGVPFGRVRQRLVEVCQEVAAVLDARRVAHQRLGDAHGGSLLFGELDMAARPWWRDRRLYRPQVGCPMGETQSGREVLHRFEAAL